MQPRNNVALLVATIPALALLKITALEDRKNSRHRRDASDLLRYVRQYMDYDNSDRAAQNQSDIYITDD